MSRQRRSIEKSARSVGMIIETLRWQPLGIHLEKDGQEGGWFLETKEGDELYAYNAADLCKQIRAKAEREAQRQAGWDEMKRELGGEWRES